MPPISSRLRRFLRVTWAAVTLVATSSAGAAEPTSTVTVAFNAEASEAAVAVRAITSHLEGLKVAVTVQPVTGQALTDLLQRVPSTEEQPSSLGQFYVDVAAGSELLVYFTEPGGASTLIRRIPPKSTAAPVALEEAGIVVRSLLEALLDGGRLGVSVPRDDTASVRTAAPEPERPTAPAPAEVTRPKRWTSLVVQYTGTSFVAGQGLESGAQFGLRVYPWTNRSPLAFSVAYTAYYPTKVDFSASEIALQRHPLEIGINYVSREPVGLLAEAMAVGDFVERTTIQTGPSLERTRAQGRWAFGMSARGGACFSPSFAAHWCLTGGVDVYLNRLVYIVNAAEAAERLSTSQVRPRLDTGLTFDFL